MFVSKAKLLASNFAWTFEFEKVCDDYNRGCPFSEQMGTEKVIFVTIFLSKLNYKVGHV